MERDNFKNYNLLYNEDNNSMIGFVEDIKHYYKACAKNYVDIELYNETRDLLDLLDKIDIELKSRDLIEVYYLDLNYKYTYRLIEKAKN